MDDPAAGTEQGARSLERFPLHLGLGATAEPQPEFPRDERVMQWYADYGDRTARDGDEGRLVSFYRFDEDWSSWEMHPAGAEVVICTEGRVELLQELNGEERRITLQSGEYAVNPAGVWHTANVTEPCAVLFITAGAGTEHRPR